MKMIYDIVLVKVIIIIVRCIRSIVIMQPSLTIEKQYN